MKLTSPAFAAGAPLSDRFAREHGNLSPPLAFAEIPPGTRSLALIMDDPDAPRGTFTHWIVYDLPPATLALAEGQLPAGAAVASHVIENATLMGRYSPSPAPAHR